MKISQRMILLIVISVLGMILLTGNTIVQLNKLSFQINNISDNVMPSIKILGNAGKELAETRNSVLAHIMAVDATKKSTIEEDYKGNYQSLMKSLEQYAPLVVDAEDRDYLNKIQQNVTELGGKFNEMIAVSRNGQTEDAMHLANNSRDLFKATQKLLDSHIEFNQKVAVKSKEDAKNVNSTAIQLSISVAIASLIILLIFAVVTYRKIAGSIKRGEESISKLSTSLDFTTRCEIIGNDEIAKMLISFNVLIEKLQSSLRTVIEASNSVATSATELVTSAEQVAAGSNAQSESASTMAAALEEITVSINHVADRTQEANKLAQDTGIRAQNGESVIVGTSHSIESIAGAVQQASQQMSQLSEQTRQIDVVVNVIKDVADQTNLLALNAAIEAARAGETGRGFAVVADEVRKLAERTAQSTQEIANIISGILSVSENAALHMQSVVTNVDNGVHEAEKARGAISSITEVAEQSRHLVGEISHAIREQGSAANSIAMQVENVAQMAEENSASAAHATELAARLQNLSDAMRKEVSTYNV